MSDQPQEIEMQESIILDIYSVDIVAETVTTTVVVNEQTNVISAQNEVTAWSEPVSTPLINDSNEKTAVENQPQVVPVMNNFINNAVPSANGLSVQDALLMKKFYITQYNMRRCAKYERVGTYERIITPRVNPLYAVLPCTDDTISSFALTPILYIIKNEDRNFEVDKKYHRKHWCMFDEGVRVTDDPCYIVLDGNTKQEIMRIKRVSKKERDYTREKREGVKELYKYTYTFQIGDLQLVMEPSLKNEDHIIGLTMEVTRTDDLGNVTTSNASDPSDAFRIYGAEHILYCNYTVTDVVPMKLGCNCCSCSGSNSCCKCSGSDNICCACLGIFLICCNCDCGGKGSSSSADSSSNELGASAEGMLNAWINVGTDEATCCKKARGRTNTITKYKQKIMDNNNEPAVFLTSYSRIEVEIVKKVSRFEEMIALIFTQLETVTNLDQYDIDKDLPEKSPCPCID